MNVGKTVKTVGGWDAFITYIVGGAWLVVHKRPGGVYDAVWHLLDGEALRPLSSGPVDPSFNLMPEKCVACGQELP